MTGTGNVNFGQMTAVSKNGLPQGVGTKSIEKASEAFSTVMNQSMDHAQTFSEKPDHAQSVVEAVNSDAADTDAAYDRYRYKEHSIEAASEDQINEKISSGEEDFENFEEEVVKAVSEELGVTEEDVVKAMELMQFTAFDLIDSEKLGMLVEELSDITDRMQLLFNSSFSELKNQIGNLANELMQKLDVSLKEFQEIIERLQLPEDAGQMENPEFVVDSYAAMPEIPQGMQQNTAEAELPQTGTTEAGLTSTDAVESTKDAVITETFEETLPTGTVRAESAPETVLAKSAADQTISEVMEGGTAEAVPIANIPEKMPEEIPAAVITEDIPKVIITEDVPEDEIELLSASKEEPRAAIQEEMPDEAEKMPDEAEEMPDEAEKMTDVLQMTDTDGKKPAAQNQHSLMSGNSHQENTPLAQQPVFTENVAETPQPEQSYSFKVETLEIIQKIVQTMKVAVSTEQTTMEMQLNPENLGKLYLEISAREGAVRAQIAAQNEAVQQALEAQIATLRESLEQAGIKVDAIEVTVASHEFEKNLEQNGRQEEETESKRQEAMKSGRRNLRLDDLDELSGLMTEEEQLVAQIMKDNGNSVDLSA